MKDQQPMYRAEYRVKDKVVRTRYYATAQLAQYRLMGTIGLFPLLGEVAGDLFINGRCITAARLGGAVAIRQRGY